MIGKKTKKRVSVLVLVFAILLQTFSPVVALALEASEDTINITSVERVGDNIEIKGEVSKNPEAKLILELGMASEEVPISEDGNFEIIKAVEKFGILENVVLKFGTSNLDLITQIAQLLADNDEDEIIEEPIIEDPKEDPIEEEPEEPIEEEPPKEEVTEEPQNEVVEEEAKKEIEEPVDNENLEKESNIGPRSIITPPKDTHTYIFIVDGVEYDRQIVKDDEILLKPESPEKENHKFMGWFVDEEKVDFNIPIAVVERESKEITVNAKFEEVYYVFFMDGTEEDSRVFVTKEGMEGDSVSTTDVKLPIASTQAVTGWYRDRNLTDGPVGDNYTIGTESVKLWPKIEEGNYLYFDSGSNGTYIEPQFVAPGVVTQAPINPERPGYDFKHWSEAENGVAFVFGNTIDSDKILYAVWEAKLVNYTVVIWKQSVNDDKNAADENKTYDYASSEIRSALPGSTVGPTSGDSNKNFKGFHYNAGKSVEVTVEADGTTVLNVYYDRNLLTIDFHRNGVSGAEDGEYTGLYGQTLAQNGYTWPSGYRWSSGPTSTRYLTFLDSFIFDELLDYGSSTYINIYARRAETGATITHYKQELDGSWAVANTTYTSYSGNFTFTNKYTGFTVYQYRTGAIWRDAVVNGSASYNRILDIRHSRNSYKLAFYNFNEVDKTENLLFENPLAGKNYTPDRPTGIPDEYVFQGWYKDEAFTEVFNFDTEKMPFNNLMIYAKWAPPIVNLTIHLGLEDNSDYILRQIIYNNPIDKATMPTVKDHLGNVLSQGDDSNIITVPEGYKWIGWSPKVGDEYIDFNFNTKILSDIDLYPYYVNNAKFEITYVANGGGGNAPIDDKKYAENSYADILSAEGLTPPTGKVFLGWTDSKGNIYQPGDKIKITDNVVLTAQWGDVKDKTKVVYKPGDGGTGIDHTVDQLIINDKIILEELGNTEIVTKPGYEFIGWKNATDGKIYGPGTELQVDNINESTENILIAQWERTVIDVIAKKVWVGGHSVDHQLVNLELYRKIEGGEYSKIEDTPITDPTSGTSTEFTYKWENQYTHDEDGKEYIYSIKEPEVDNSYTSVVTGSNYEFTVTNTYHNFKEIEAKKYWYGVNGPNEKPDIWFTLYRKTETGTGEVVPELNPEKIPPGNDSVHWQNLIGEDEEGRPYSFYVKETDKDGNDFVPEGFEKEEDGLDVYNYKGSKKINFTVKKDWTNVPNQFKTDINVQLKRDGLDFGEEVLLNEENSWTYSWTELDKYKNANEMYDYTVEEDISNLHEYVSHESTEYTEYDVESKNKTGIIKNKLTNPTEDVIATKVWDITTLDDGLTVSHPTMLFTLYRSLDGVNWEKVPDVVPIEITENETDAKWEGLEKLDPAGIEYQFKVVETFKEDNPTNENWIVKEEGLKVTNTVNSPVGKLTIKKVLKNEPQKIRSLSLFGNNDPIAFGFKVTGPYGYEETFTLIAGQSITLENLYYGEYTVEETQAHGYTVSYDPGQNVSITKSANEATVTVTNNNTGGDATTVSKTITKVWVNGPKPGATLELWRKGQALDGAAIDEKVGESFNATATELTKTYSGLAKHDPSGREFEYYAKEPTVPEHYTAVVEGLKVTNTYSPPNDGAFGANKVWSTDGLDEGLTVTYPTMIFTLYRSIDNENWEKAPDVEPIEITETNTHAIWKDLPVYDVNGNTYSYKVEETFKEDDILNENWVKEEGDGNILNRLIYNDPEDDNHEDEKIASLTVKKVLENEPPTRSFGIFESKEPLSFKFKITGPYGFEKNIELAAGESVILENLYYGDYQVEETEAHGYAPSYNPAEGKVRLSKRSPAGEVIVTNSNTGGEDTTVSKTITKVWVNGPKPGATLELWRKGQALDGAAIDEKVGESFNATATELTKTYSGLAKHDPSGREFEYYVKEDTVPENYTASINQETLTVTNTYTAPSRDDKVVVGKKSWLGDEKWDKKEYAKPDTWFKLQRKVSNGVWEDVNNSIRKVPGSNEVSWTVPIKNDQGQSYDYRVKEVDRLGKDYVPSGFTKVEDGMIVRNYKKTTTPPTPSYPPWIINPTAPTLNKHDHFGYVIGYPQGDFRQEGTITRGEMTAIFARLLEEKIFLTKDYPLPFSDVARNSWYAEYIGMLTQVGVIAGYPDGTFRPEDPVTRAEFATVASRFIQTKKSGFGGFSDISSDYWAKGSIEAAYAQGWLKGYPDGSFRPEKELSRAETVTIVNRMLDRVADKRYVDTNRRTIVNYIDLNNSHWAYYEIMEASNSHDYERTTNRQERWIRHWRPY